jgi:hypothetical protein
VGSRLEWHAQPVASRMNVGRLICFALETDCVRIGWCTRLPLQPNRMNVRRLIFFFWLGRLRGIQAGLNAAPRRRMNVERPLFLRWKANIVGLG